MRVDSNSCGDGAEDGAKTAQWAVFSSAARDIHPRPPKNLSVCKYAEVFVFPGLSLSRKKHLHFRHAVL